MIFIYNLIFVFVIITYYSTTAFAGCYIMGLGGDRGDLNFIVSEKGINHKSTVTTDGSICEIKYLSYGNYSHAYTESSIIKHPNNGKIAQINLTQFEYTPRSSFTGSDNFTIKICALHKTGTQGCVTNFFDVTVTNKNSKSGITTTIVPVENNKPLQSDLNKASSNTQLNTPNLDTKASSNNKTNIELNSYTNELAKARAEAEKAKTEAQKAKAEMEAYKEKYSQSAIVNNNQPKLVTENPPVKTEDAIFVDDVQLFFTGGGSVDVVTFVPLLQAAKQKTENKQTDSSQAVYALKIYLNSNQAFQTFYTQLITSRADEKIREKEILLLTVKNAEKTITDYIRANLNDPNLNQYLDAVKMIGMANSDTSSDNLKIIIKKLSLLNPAYAQQQSSNGNSPEQKILVQTQNNLPPNNKSPNDDFNLIFPSGIYAKTEKDCARYLANPKQRRMDDRFERVTIEGRDISRYSTGGCTVRSITGTDSTYSITADCTEEGETSKQKYSFSIRNGKFNFGQFDETGKNWWNFCSQNKVTINNETPQAHSASPIQVTTGARCGASAVITMLDGENGRSAQFNAIVTKEIAEEACSCNAPGGVLKGQRLQVCIRDALKNATGMEARADCQLKTIRDTNGNVRMMTGKIIDGEVELVDVSTRKQVETASYTGYSASINQLSILCPALLCLPSIPYSQQLDGCKK